MFQYLLLFLFSIGHIFYMQASEKAMRVSNNGQQVVKFFYVDAFNAAKKKDYKNALGFFEQGKKQGEDQKHIAYHLNWAITGINYAFIVENGEDRQAILEKVKNNLDQHQKNVKTDDLLLKAQFDTCAKVYEEAFKQWATAVQKCQPLQKKYNTYFDGLQRKNRLNSVPNTRQLNLYNQAKKAHEKNVAGLLLNMQSDRALRGELNSADTAQRK
ncbi:MAG TPA: hypothetical protein VEK38_02145 [Candidatus Bathyarchaeia archaeon]|nr:hypothetical protein [Candidatus Bathyarchaeia archaeon]